jgi:peptidoglycan hydrolase-like protein with peptidoglycan-binding domain
LLDFDNQPMANLNCKLHVEGDVLELKTDGDGLIEREIPETSQSALVTYTDLGSGLDVGIPIKIGHLDPLEEVSGQKGRLNNLGYNAGRVDQGPDEQFKIAVQEFQCDFELKVDGVCGSSTQAKLKEIHGC